MEEGREWQGNCPYTTVISKPKMFPATTVNLTNFVIEGTEISPSWGNIQLTSPSVKVFVKQVRTRAQTPVLYIPYYYQGHMTAKR